MSDIYIVRQWATGESTIGVLTFGAVSCYTLEDTRRPDGTPKVFGATAIPPGRYRVRISWSNRFGRMMPEVVDVPGFTGIRIHAGNTAADTQGCILLGRTRKADWVGESRGAFAEFFAALRKQVDLGEVWLQITEKLV